MICPSGWNLHSDDEIAVLAADFNHMTARLENESRAHREVEVRLRATIDNALDAVVQMNAAGIITGWNIQAENIFGWTHNEAVGQLLHEINYPAPVPRASSARHAKIFRHPAREPSAEFAV